ncbi:hypothetical protein [Brevundimonas sp.]|uniref:hypothetical protein n=1 Tax=Brevundimonas sp. TaxID=1871086 RepID=UPI002FC6C40E
MPSLIRFAAFLIPLFHAVVVMTGLTTQSLSWPLFIAVFLLLPFYALGFRVAADWLQKRVTSSRTPR